MGNSIRDSTLTETGSIEERRCSKSLGMDIIRIASQPTDTRSYWSKSQTMTENYVDSSE